MVAIALKNSKVNMSSAALKKNTNSDGVVEQHEAWLFYPKLWQVLLYRLYVQTRVCSAKEKHDSPPSELCDLEETTSTSMSTKLELFAPDALVASVMGKLCVAGDLAYFDD